MDEKELKALVTLLEDDDQEIKSHVEEKIISLGTKTIPFLEEEWEKSFNPEVQRRIEDMIHILQFELLQEKLSEWKDHETENLLKGVWLISTYQYPDLTLEELQTEFDKVYQDVWREFKEDSNPKEQVKILNNMIFNKFRFRANTKNFHSPSNSMINVVLQSKKGNPITLCVIYMIIAQRLDMPVYGVNLPNLFILTYKEEAMQFYINVFNKGLVFSRDDIDNYIDHLGLPAKEVFYEPCTHEDIMLRCLRNLVVSFEKLGDYSKADEMKILMNILEDDQTL
ncbi:MAG: transglutaminase-like domain-containing protein [Cyclobacteriaceae bacterium]